MKLRSMRDREIVLKLEGREYIWPKKGSAMTVPEKVGAWLFGKANDKDRNPKLTADRKRLNKPDLQWLEIVEAEEGEQKETMSAVIAEMPKDNPPAKPQAQPAAPPAKPPEK